MFFFATLRKETGFRVKPLMTIGTPLPRTRACRIVGA
jgi:hypothetical protein